MLQHTLAGRLEPRRHLLNAAARAPRAVKVVSVPARDLCQKLYDRLPPEALGREPFLSLGRLIQRCAYRRHQNISTCFLRNRPELCLLGKLAATLAQSQSELKLAVLGCSTGPEAFSAVWSIQSACPNLQLEASGVDIEEEALEVARKGEYPEGCGALHRLDDAELDCFFERTEAGYRVRQAVRDPITWIRADVCVDDLLERIGPQDIVLANRFLCHMEAPVAEEAFRRIIALVRPGGYLFVSGVDPDVRVKVSMEESLEPLVEESEPVYSGDPSLSAGWPTVYWGLEPFNQRTKNWEYRYAPVFQRP